MVLPSLEKLQSSREIQDQVYTRIKNLQSTQEEGKLKSQRGGTERIFAMIIKDEPDIEKKQNMLE